MKAALIPPIPHLHQFGEGQFHLLLTHLLADKKYRDHYRAQRRSGAYLVLDNSAHEKGKGEDPLSLLKAGFDLNAQEIVVPDVLDNAEETIESALCSMEEWFERSKSREILEMYSPAFMYVPQGKDEDDWVACLDALISIHNYCSRKYSLRRDIVIGVSKDYDTWDGGLLNLVTNHVYPRREDLAQRGIKMHVHLLGWMRNLWNLQILARVHPWLRSTDSAKPFVYARSQVNLLSCVTNDPPQYPTRQKDYFDKKFTPNQLVTAQDNVWVFRQAAEGMLW